MPDALWSAPHGVRDWARAHELFIPALHWVADYERWVLGARNFNYRRSCVESWQRTQVPAEGLAETWDALAEQCGEAMRAFIAARMTTREHGRQMG